MNHEQDYAYKHELKQFNPLIICNVPSGVCVYRSVVLRRAWENPYFSLGINDNQFFSFSIDFVFTLLPMFMRHFIFLASSAYPTPYTIRSAQRTKHQIQSTIRNENESHIDLILKLCEWIKKKRGQITFEIPRWFSVRL